MSKTALEIYGRGFGWSWQLRVEGDVVATTDTTTTSRVRRVSPRNVCAKRSRSSTATGIVLIRTKTDTHA